jgi:hypothetical protein
MTNYPRLSRAILLCLQFRLERYAENFIWDAGCLVDLQIGIFIGDGAVGRKMETSVLCTVAMFGLLSLPERNGGTEIISSRLAQCSHK